MWSMLKMIVGAIMLGAMAYVAFFVDFGGKTLSVHAQEVWRAPVVRQKVDLMRDGVKRHLEEKLAAAGAEAGAEAGRRGARLVAGEVDELTAADREKLKQMLEEVADSPQARSRSAGVGAP